MLLQRVPAHEAEYDGEALSLHARPPAGNHSRGKSAPARPEADSPHAGDELTGCPLSLCPQTLTLPRATICCGLFSPKILGRAISPPRRRFPPGSVPAAKWFAKPRLLLPGSNCSSRFSAYWI